MTWCWLPGAARTRSLGRPCSPRRCSPPRRHRPPLAPTRTRTASPRRERTCGIREGNTLWCWGDNAYGDLGTGNGLASSCPSRSRPGEHGWASVTGGASHCATRTDGTLWCWGDNEYGQLGIGSYHDQDRPQQVTSPGSTGWASVSRGGVHTCATRTDGTLWCWGDNDTGQLGIGSSAFTKDLPQQVSLPGSAGWASVTAGSSYTCATRGAPPCGAGARAPRPARRRQTAPTRNGPGSHSPPGPAGPA